MKIRLGTAAAGVIRDRATVIPTAGVVHDIIDKSTRGFAFEKIDVPQSSSPRPLSLKIESVYLDHPNSPFRIPLPTMEKPPLSSSIRSKSASHISCEAATPKQSNMTKSFSNRFLFGDVDASTETAGRMKPMSSTPTCTYEVDAPCPVFLKKSHSTRLDLLIEQDSWSGATGEVNVEAVDHDDGPISPATPRTAIGKLRAEVSIISRLTKNRSKDWSLKHIRDEGNEGLDGAEQVEEVLMNFLEPRISDNIDRRCDYKTKKECAKKDTPSTSSTQDTSIDTLDSEPSAKLDQPAGESVTQLREEKSQSHDLALTDIFSWSKSSESTSSTMGHTRVKSPRHSKWEHRQAPIWRENPRMNCRDPSSFSPEQKKDSHQDLEQLSASHEDYLFMGDHDTNSPVKKEKDYQQFFAKLAASTKDMIFICEDTDEYWRREFDDSCWSCDSPQPPSIECSCSDYSEEREPLQLLPSLEESWRSESGDVECNRAAKRSILRWTERFGEF